MPFEEDEDLDSLKKFNAVKLKNPVPQTQKPKRPSSQEFEKKVKEVQDQKSEYKQRASDLTVQFKKIIEDKTLVQNKNIFSLELEKDVLSKMIQLAIEINNDPNEEEGMGSLSWIALLFKTIISQRDKINNLEYSISKIERVNFKDFISSEIKKQLQELDNNKKSE